MTDPTTSLAAALAGRYAIQRPLGEGGMARVFLARDLRYDRFVALKVLRPELGAALGPERFLAEIRTTAQLVHPHILPLLDSGETAGLLWFATPYVEGETLRHRLERETQLPIPEAVRLAREIAAALAAAHKRGIIHRDIKPENVLLQDGAALVADFGIALAVREAGGTRLTETGISLGTPQYMSPEQAAGGEALDPRTDVYSLGAVLYERLAGEAPHTGPTAQVVIAKLMSESPVALRRVRPAVSPALEAVVERALAKVPADRYTDAEQLARALAAPAVVQFGGPDPPKARRRWALARRVLGLGAAAAGLLAAIWWLDGRAWSSEPVAAPLAAGAPRLQLTTDASGRAPTLSPDGQRFAYAATRCGHADCTSSIEVRDFAGAGRLRVTDGLGRGDQLRYSPDGRWLIAQTTVARVWGAYLVPALGGSPRFVGCCYASFYGGSDTLANAPLVQPGSRPRVYLSTVPDGVVRDSIVVRDVRADWAVFAASPWGGLLAMAGGDARQGIAVIFRRDGIVTDTLPSAQVGAGAWHWSARGDALLWARTDPVDRRLTGWWRYPIDPVTGRRRGPGRPILLREASMIGAFDVAPGTGDMLVELSARRHVGWMLARGPGGYSARPFRQATVPFFAAASLDGRTAFVATPTGGDSTVAFSVMDLETGSERAIGQVRSGALDNVSWGYAARWDGPTSVVVLLPEDTLHTTLRRVTPGTGEVQMLARLPGSMRRATPLSGGEVLVSGFHDRQLIRVGPDGAQAVLELPDSLPWSFPAYAPVSADRFAAFSGADEAGRNALHLLDWASRRITRVASVPYEDGLVWLDAEGGKVSLAVQTAPWRHELLSFSIPAGRSESVAQLPAGTLRYPAFSFSADRSRGIIVGVEELPDVWLIRGRCRQTPASPRRPRADLAWPPPVAPIRYIRPELPPSFRTSMSDPLGGQLLGGRYRLERELGRGGMAIVHLATDVRHDRAVAVKRLEPALAAALGTDRFLREIRLTARLNHPNILALHDSGEADGVPYYVTPVVEGESLRDRLRRERQLPIDLTLDFGRQVGLALHSAHGQGIVHRDVKPENILLTGRHAVVADFGIALAVQSAGGERLTESGLSLGTPTYMSPEQIGTAPIDGRSDQYSLACVIYEMIAGEPPFTGATSMAVLARHALDPVPPLATLRPGVAPHVARALERALAKAPADRFETVEAFLTALTAPAAEPEPSIVVLPFANLSPDADNEYFADGLTEDVIMDLSKVRALKVISRNSAMQLKGTTKDTRTLGRELGVTYVLEGTVRRAGSSLRVTAQLIDAARDTHLWAERYSGTVDDVFEIQEQLARKIVAALHVALAPEEARRLAERPLADPRALECYHRARLELYRFTGPGLQQALRLLEAGIAIVGENGFLRAVQSLIFIQAFDVSVESEADLMAEADRYAELAARLDPDGPATLLARGSIAFKRGDLQAAVRLLKGAMDRAPNLADGLLWLAQAYGNAGRTDAARPVITRLLEIDPLTPINHCMPGFSEAIDGRMAEALPHLHKWAALDPMNPFSHFVLIWFYLALGSRDAAAAEAREVARLAPGSSIAQIGAFLSAAAQGDERAALAALTPELARAAGSEGQLAGSLHRPASCGAERTG